MLVMPGTARLMDGQRVSASRLHTPSTNL
jgi:hypothetical protein